MHVFLIILNIGSILQLASCTFTPDFAAFLSKRSPGSGLDRAMARSDMGVGMMGSFGGKSSPDEKIKQQPVVFIHGVTLRAGIFTGHVQYFNKQGYTMAELYGTTYGDGGQTAMFSKTMTCADVRQVRTFIMTVNEYTNSSVDVIAYSMGTAISRKAILGGRCVDTGEDLGPPLTEIVDTFVAVGGVAYGLENCMSHTTSLPACNLINGMACGSKYLLDVNAHKLRYEGQHSFALYSEHDRVVGQNCCGHQCSELDFASAQSIHQRKDHGSILTMTKHIQLKMIQDHVVE